jgi:hypothetical protein
VHSSPPWLLLLLVPMFQASANNGIKMTIRFGQAENSNEHTVYVAGDRKRMEFRNSSGTKNADGSRHLTYGPRLVAIIRCDLGQTFQLNLDTSEFTSAPYPPKPLTREQIEARGLQIPAASEKPTLRIEVHTTDTGERKEMFGHIARHVLTTSKQTPLEGSSSDPEETVTDAWYIDLNQRLSCDPDWSQGKHAHAYSLFTNGKQPREKVEFIPTGEAQTGFPLQSVMTSKFTHPMPDGTRKQTDSRTELLVTELEEEPLDPALFEIPPGFRHVQRIERNSTPSASSTRIEDLWQRLKASVTSLFNL